MSDMEKIRTLELVIKSIENQITQDEFAELDNFVASSRENAHYFTHCIATYMSIIDSQEVAACNGRLGEVSFDENLWQQLSEDEKTAPAIEIPKEKPVRGLIQKEAVPAREKKKLSKFQIFTLITSAAAVLFVIIFPKVFPPVSNSIAIAMLNAEVDARWSDSTGSLKSGDTVYSGTPFSLIEGLVEIQTDNGVELIVEGPAEFELTKEGDLRLDTGKVYAGVSAQGRGFTIATATSKIVDLGTEFGVQAEKSGSTEVHVYKGQVTLLTGTRTMEKVAEYLLQGQARVVSSDGTVTQRRLNEYLFVRKDEFGANIRASEGMAYDRWLAFSYKLRRDQSLVAYYTFEKDEQRPEILANKASLTEGMLDGSLYSASGGLLPTWTTGRWPQKTALNFDRSERQVVIVPGDPILHINGPITIAAWVKCDDPTDGGHLLSCRLPGLDQEGNYQFGYNAPPGTNADWKDKIQFGRMTGKKENLSLHDRINSTQTFGASDQWRFIAATHDNYVVKLYMDGRFIESHELTINQNPVVADLVIGADNVVGDPSRFTGVMDEIMIFKRVLTSVEISEIYKAGQAE